MAETNKLLEETANYLLSHCFLLGGVFCMACDWIARTAFSPTELAISTETAFFGAPIVIVMALKRGGGHR